MQHTVHFETLEPPWVADEAWQETADTVFKALAIHGCLTLQLKAGGRHLSALQEAFACVRDMFTDQALCSERLCAAGEAADVGLQDLGYKQVLDYRSGPWPAGTQGAQQHSILQKVCACRFSCQGACSVACIVFSLVHLFVSCLCEQPRLQLSLASAAACRPWHLARTCAEQCCAVSLPAEE